MTYIPWTVIAGETPTATKWNYLGGNDADSNTRVSKLETDKTLASNVDGGVITFDLAASKIHTVTLAGSRTLAVTNEEVGKSFVVRLVQNGTGNWSVTWWGGIKWPGGSPPQPSTGANEISSFGFLVISAGVYDGYFLGFGLE